MTLKVTIEATEADAVALLAKYGPAPSAGGVVTPPVAVTPAPAATYRVLTMADAPAITDTVPPTAVTLGNGAHTLTFMVEMRALAAPAGTPFEFDLWLSDENGRHHIASMLRSTGSGWQDAGHPNGQRFTLSGDWGATLEALEIVPNGIAWADYIAPQAAFYDGVQLVNALNGTDTYIGLLQGQSGTFAPQAALPPPPPPPAPQVAGDGSLTKLIAAANDGDTITLPAGVIKDTAVVNKKLTIVGALDASAKRLTTIDATGIAIASGKGVFCPSVTEVEFGSMRFTGAATAPGAGDNGAAIRQMGDLDDFTMRNCEVDHCQDGILSFDANVTLIGNDFHDNGNGTGQTHNFYLGEGGALAVDKVATVTDNTSTNPIGGHAGKSRYGTTLATGNHMSAPDGKCWDIPAGGIFISTNEVWSKPAGAGDHGLFSMGLENKDNAGVVGGEQALIDNLRVEVPNGNEFMLLRASVPLNLKNPITYVGPTPPAINWLADGAVTTGVVTLAGKPVTDLTTIWAKAA